MKNEVTLGLSGIAAETKVPYELSRVAFLSDFNVLIPLKEATPLGRRKFLYGF